MGRDLSVEAKQTFRIVALMATFLVVGIHYKSAIPVSANPADATWNELAQEFVFGGLARVAVPMFAFAAGLFYFLRDDGTLASYRTKLHARVRTVLVPFFLSGSIAMAFWLIVRRSEGKLIDLTLPEFVLTWLLHPPAEQLWFLRDLLLLVIVAPAIRWFGTSKYGRRLLAPSLMLLWLFDWQLFPAVVGWRLIHSETLLFFVLGFFAVSRLHLLERVVTAPVKLIVAAWFAWLALTATRIFIRADFDIWYVDNHGFADLMLHQTSILVGSLTLFATASRMRWPGLLSLSGGSFFVYLVHEFPLRAVAHRVCDGVIDHSYSCWVLTPAVLLVCYTASVMLSRWCPMLISVLTGGRMPSPSITSTPHSPALTS